MTEKRFIYKIKNGAMVIIDKKDNVLIRDKYRACDYLNQLNNENEQLKSELISKDDLIQQLKIKLNMDYYNEWKKCNLKYTEICEELLEINKLYKKLSDENEQLKQQLNKQDKIIQELKSYLLHMGYKTIQHDDGHISLEQIEIKKMEIRNVLLDGWIE